MLRFLRYDPPRTVIYDEASGRYHVRRPAQYPTPDNPYEYYDRSDRRWMPAKDQVLDAFSSESHARLYAAQNDKPPIDRGETDRIIV
ncbi:hypothetical protein GURKE_01610 [Brevundimonas phage vB_BpoS-Gurke]|uniref:Uncharacterized protein n=1 Tax=Brevundimonas phage vB_BpoS-Gurke TaxID=2948599 RepID=A0A9E7STC2_9CAUD|nr:hypothetical protein GURKE_01610 [Brevundimonas phage vB_BpoS-Gurke]